MADIGTCSNNGRRPMTLLLRAMSSTVVGARAAKKYVGVLRWRAPRPRARPG